MTLTIVIPAYNEEAAITAICERTLAARAAITQKTPVNDVRIVVVSDGSHDRTPEIAAQFADIDLIAYPKNKGYGAAIKLGFDKIPSDLVSFLDADGTCDPLFFVDLINEMHRSGADVMLGSRMGKDSRMPAIRRVGNVLFATLMRVLSGSKVKDTASGMRVIKRSALSKLYPLPDGLHFTPAMSAKAIFHQELSIGELPMSYEERIGESKLNPFKDGLRFLRVIIETAIQFKPNLFFNILGGLFVMLALVLGFTPLQTWANSGAIADDMVYRLVSGFVLINVGVLLLSAGQIAKGFLGLIHYPAGIQKPAFAQKLFLQHGLLVGLVFFILSSWILWAPFTQWLNIGSIATPWYVFLMGQLLFLLAFIFTASGALGVVYRLISLQISKKEPF